MQVSEHFPWTTSMMVFVVVDNTWILLRNESGRWGTYLFETTGEVDIRNMVCTQLQQRSIKTPPDKLLFLGVIDEDGRSVFIYSVAIGENEIPKDEPWVKFRIGGEYFMRQPLNGIVEKLLPRILTGKPIGIQPVST